MISSRRTWIGAVAIVAALATAPAALAKAAPPPTIRVGGPSATGEAKIAIVGSNQNLSRHRFRVVSKNGDVVLRGRLQRAPRPPGPLAPCL